ncbi:Zinc finger CCCH domain-containing protein 48 [Acorus gramineus]|uniref:Zinc finger CCCH domain-containing protein 48 n=1 Tax=Acorus gramineus TaxID=55184 RepID=A0AAV9AC47_ACOGR|nr:Zinc finger CCCH domain-containing protein 48 [Acorus gramineus]
MHLVNSFNNRGRLISKEEVKVMQLGPGGLIFSGDSSADVDVAISATLNASEPTVKFVSWFAVPLTPTTTRSSPRLQELEAEKPSALVIEDADDVD